VQELDTVHWTLSQAGVPFSPTLGEERDLGFDMGVSVGIWTMVIQFDRARK